MSYASDMGHDDGGLYDGEDDRFDPDPYQFDPRVDDVDEYDRCVVGRWFASAHASAMRRTEYKPSDDPSVWVTASGVTKRLADMTDAHLANALGRQVHYHGVTHSRTRALLAELTQRSLPPQQAPSITTCTTTGASHAID